MRTLGFRGFISTAGSFWRPLETPHSVSVSSVYGMPVAMV